MLLSIFAQAAAARYVVQPLKKSELTPILEARLEPESALPSRSRRSLPHDCLARSRALIRLFGGTS